MDAMERSAQTVNDWKHKITENYNRWLDQIETCPSGVSPQEDKDWPDLYSFFEALCVLRSDVSKSSRRSHETFTRFGNTLDGFERLMREMAQHLAAGQQDNDRMPYTNHKKFLTPYAELIERMDRLADKLSNPPKSGFFSSNGKWDSAWAALKQGFDLLREHFQLLLRESGVVPMETMGHCFDPTKMKAVAVEDSETVAHNTVIEELVAGYYLKDEVLKFAEVKIAINKGSIS